MYQFLCNCCNDYLICNKDTDLVYLVDKRLAKELGVSCNSSYFLSKYNLILSYTDFKYISYILGVQKGTLDVVSGLPIKEFERLYKIYYQYKEVPSSYKVYKKFCDNLTNLAHDDICLLRNRVISVFSLAVSRMSNMSSRIKVDNELEKYKVVSDFKCIPYSYSVAYILTHFRNTIHPKIKASRKDLVFNSVTKYKDFFLNTEIRYELPVQYGKDDIDCYITEYKKYFEDDALDYVLGYTNKNKLLHDITLDDIMISDIYADYSLNEICIGVKNKTDFTELLKEDNSKNYSCELLFKVNKNCIVYDIDADIIFMCKVSDLDNLDCEKFDGIYKITHHRFSWAGEFGYFYYILDYGYNKGMSLSKFIDLYDYIKGYHYFPQSRETYLRYIRDFNYYAKENNITFEVAVNKVYGMIGQHFNSTIYEDDLRHYNSHDNKKLPPYRLKVYTEIHDLHEGYIEMLENLTFDDFIIKKQRLTKKDICFIHGDFDSVVVRYTIPSTVSSKEFLRRSIKAFQRDFCKDALNQVVEYSHKVKYLQDLELFMLKINDFKVSYTSSEVLLTIALKDGLSKIRDDIYNEKLGEKMERQVVVK